MPESEHVLVHRAAQGDAEALTALLEEAGKQVRQHLCGQIPQRWQSLLAVDDVMQVTYLEAFLRIGVFRPDGPGAFVAWLKTIAMHNVQDAIRALECTKRAPPARQDQPRRCEDSCVVLLDLLTDSASTPSRHATREESCDLLNAAVDRLPTDYQRVIRMFDLEGRACTEVAAAVGRSEGAVYMLRARAHDRLRELLGAESNFFSDCA